MDVIRVTEENNSDDMWLCRSCPGRFIAVACELPEVEQDMTADSEFDLDIYGAIVGDNSKVPASNANISTTRTFLNVRRAKSSTRGAFCDVKKGIALAFWKFEERNQR